MGVRELVRGGAGGGEGDDLAAFCAVGDLNLRVGGFRPCGHAILDISAGCLIGTEGFPALLTSLCFP